MRVRGPVAWLVPAILAAALLFWGLVLRGSGDREPRTAPGPGRAPPSDRVRSDSDRSLPGDPPRPGCGLTVVAERDRCPTRAAVSLWRRPDPERASPGAEPEWYDEALRTGLPAGAPTAHASTDARGSVRIDGLPPGEYLVRADAAGGIWGVETVRLLAEGQMARARVRLAGGPSTIRGLAVWRNGEPFHGEVHVHDGRVVATDPRGRFVVGGLEADAVDLEFLVPGRFRSIERRVDAPSGGEVRIVVDDGLLEVREIVVAAATRTPIPGAEVLGDSARVTTDAEGAFRLSVRTRRRRIRVTAPRFAPTELEFPEPATEIHIVLRRPGSVCGRVLSGTDGKGLPGIPVEAREPEGAILARTVSGDGGAYRLDAVPPGEAMVYAMGGASPRRRGSQAWARSCESRRGSRRVPNPHRIEAA